MAPVKTADERRAAHKLAARRKVINALPHEKLVELSETSRPWHHTRGALVDRIVGYWDEAMTDEVLAYIKTMVE
jgi:tryptophan 2,3-dioxygenase